jgi:hypothetical protein
MWVAFPFMRILKDRVTNHFVLKEIALIVKKVCGLAKKRDGLRKQTGFEVQWYENVR